MIKDKIQTKLGKAFDKKLADAVYTFKCVKTINTGKFDYITQKYETKTETSYTGRGVLFCSYKKDLVKPADYQAEDSKATVLQNEVSAEPQINDVWATPKGSFKIIDIGADPADAIYSIQLRKVGG